MEVVPSRKTPPFASSHEASGTAMPPATPAALPKPASAPTTRLRKRKSMGRPLSSSTRPESERRTVASTPYTGEERDYGRRQEPLAENSRPPSTHANSVFEFRANPTAKPPWLRKKSTMSSSRGGSPVSTAVPNSPSVSYSNGSTAPILPDFSDANPVVTTHRNKLVKRSSSQRALSSSTMHSTLRRPATSHQRSANLQQQSNRDETPVLRATPRSSMLFHDVQEEDVSSDEAIQSWQCMFRPKNIRLGKDGSSRPRNPTSSAHKHETLKTVVPDMNELPTLLLGTSITPRSAEGGSSTDRLANFVDHRPMTPAGIEDTSDTSHADTGLVRRKAKAETELDPRPRRSFSIADMFPSPSPSTWKIPRSGSLRRAKGSVGVASGKRIVSAPQATRPGHTRGPSYGRSGHGSLARSKPSLQDNRTTPPPDASPINAYGRAASSPLPPLNRLSAFEIELPGAPSYPTTPQSDVPFSSPRLSSPPSPSMSSPLAPFSNRNRSLHPSLAISDKGSTLLGSDNDNSRILSGDEDDNDFRSETAYDSTRTGATGSSHSNLRKPPIETIFDESATSDYQRNKTMALQELLSHDSFNSIDVQRNRIAEEEESTVTPIPAARSSKESNHGAPVDALPEQLPESLTSPSAHLQKSFFIGEPRTAAEEISDEEVWAIESLSVSDSSSGHEKPMMSDAGGSPVSIFPHLPDHGANGFGPQPTFERSDSAPRPNISGWSESPAVGRDSPLAKPRMREPQAKEVRGSRTTARRGPSALHSRSQSVPVAPESSSHRANTSKLEAWVLGNKGVSEDWDCDFEFEEKSPAPRPRQAEDEPIRTSVSSGMLVPRSIMERQASVHGQFGHVKELTILVEELKLLRQQASSLNVMNGQSAELWKEADGIINLATLDDEEQDFFPPRSPNSPGFDYDPFEEDSPPVSSRRRSVVSPLKEYSVEEADGKAAHQTPQLATPERSRQDTPQGSRPRKESAAKAKSVLETIHQQRNYYSPHMSQQKNPQKKLPFDTTSLRDLVTRAGVVKRALKEIVRRAEKAAEGYSPSSPPDPPTRDSTPPDPPPKPDPPFSQIFQPPNPSTSTSKSPRITQSPKGGNNNNTNTNANKFRNATIAGNDNEINGHMKMMTVV
ncbi:MAG: hypothetical protein LQ345_005461 [Seirophora villosa]|nr:MAG: hypothetical protein LQ345_005461 [Seirophora villosa]